MNKKNNRRIFNNATILVKRNNRASRSRSQASKEKTARDRKTRKRRRKCFGGSSRKRIWAVESENGKWVTRTRRSRASEMTTSPTKATAMIRASHFSTFSRATTRRILSLGICHAEEVLRSRFHFELTGRFLPLRASRRETRSNFCSTIAPAFEIAIHGLSIVFSFFIY